jgi:capsular polysaccharide biosynthesis protein
LALSLKAELSTKIAMAVFSTQPESASESSSTAPTTSAPAGGSLAPQQVATTLPRCSIADIATGFTQIEQSEPIVCKSEVGLSQLLFQTDQARLMHAATSTANVRLFEVDNVVMDADSLLLFHDGVLIAESDYFVPQQANRTDIRVGTHPTHADDATIVIGYNSIAGGYQSWLTHCLPAIDWSLRHPSERPVQLLLPELETWQNDFLRLLGYDQVPRFTPTRGARYHFNRIRFAEFLIGTHRHAVSRTLCETAQRILAGVQITPTDAQIIYVPGTHYYYGTLSNEADAIDFLRQEGVHIVEPTLTTEERINLFRNADVVIGPLGQGLSDIMFCRAGTLLWEWMPRHHLNPAFNRLAQAAGVDYLGDMFPPTSSELPGAWTVQLDVIRHRFGQIRDRLVRLGQSTLGSTGTASTDPTPRAEVPPNDVPPSETAATKQPPADDTFGAFAPIEMPELGADAANPTETDETLTDGSSDAHLTPITESAASPPVSEQADIALPETTETTEPLSAQSEPANPQEADALKKRDPSAMDYLTAHPAPPAEPPVKIKPKKSFLSRIFGG